MYEKYFNLKNKPFSLQPNPEFLFHSKSHKRALAYLDYGIRERAGFILLTGEIGSGKTTLIRDLLIKHHDGVVVSKVFNTSGEFELLLGMINDDFNLPVAGKDKIGLLRDLNDFMIDQYAKGIKPILIIDEAQNLTPETLEEVRMLSNLETDNMKLLQIVLVGQPELRKTLALPGLRQLRQRISINCYIHPLFRMELEEYILHRLNVAGNRNAVDFSMQALDLIYKCSRGIPRLINIICDFIMLSAFAEETDHIDEEMVRDIIGDLDFDKSYWGDENGVETARESGGDPPEKAEADACPHPITEIVVLTQAVREMSSRLETLEKELSCYSRKDAKEMEERIASLESVIQHKKQEECFLPHFRGPGNNAGFAVTKATTEAAGESNVHKGLLTRIFRG